MDKVKLKQFDRVLTESVVEDTVKKSSSKGNGSFIDVPKKVYRPIDCLSRGMEVIARLKKKGLIK